MKVYEVLSDGFCKRDCSRLRVFSEDVISYLSLYVSLSPDERRRFESYLGPDEFEVPF